MSKKLTIEVEIEDATGEMFLTQDLGKGSLGKTNFEASIVLPTYSFSITIGKKTYLVPSKNIIESVVNFADNNK